MSSESLTPSETSEASFSLFLLHRALCLFLALHRAVRRSVILLMKEGKRHKQCLVKIAKKRDDFLRTGHEKNSKNS